jgi:hypothetical protein
VLAVLNGLSVTDYLEGDETKAKEAYEAFLDLLQRGFEAPVERLLTVRVPSLAAFLVVATLSFAATSATAPQVRVSLGTKSVTETTYIADGVEQNRRFRLAPEETLAWLGRYQRPWENHVPEWRAFMNGRYGFRTLKLSFEWNTTSAPEPELVPFARARFCPRWRAPRP